VCVCRRGRYGWLARLEGYLGCMGHGFWLDDGVVMGGSEDVGVQMITCWRFPGILGLVGGESERCFFWRRWCRRGW